MVLIESCDILSSVSHLEKMVAYVRAGVGLRRLYPVIIIVYSSLTVVI